MTARLEFHGYLQPPSVPPDPVGDDWRGIQGVAGPQGAQGPAGTGTGFSGGTAGMAGDQFALTKNYNVPLTGDPHQQVNRAYITVPMIREIWNNFDDTIYNVPGGADASPVSALVSRYIQLQKYTDSPNVVNWPLIVSMLDLTGHTSAIAGPVVGIELNMEASGLDNTTFPYGPGRVLLNMIGTRSRNYGGTDTVIARGIDLFADPANVAFKRGINVSAKWLEAGIDLSSGVAGPGSPPAIKLAAGHAIDFTAAGTRQLKWDSAAFSGAGGLRWYGNLQVDESFYVPNAITVGGAAVFAGAFGTSGTASFGTGSANHIDLIGSNSPTIQVAGSFTNGGLVLRSKGFGAVQLGSETAGNILRLNSAASGTGGDGLILTQPVAAGTALQFTAIQGVASGGVKFLNLPIAFANTYTWSGTIGTNPLNRPMNITQVIGGINTDSATAVPNNILIDYTNFTSGGSIRTYQMNVRTNGGSAMTSQTSLVVTANQGAQPKTITDIAWAATTSYSILGTLVYIPTGAILRLTTVGTSGATAPTITSSGDIGGTRTDGTCVWSVESIAATFQQGIGTSISAGPSFNIGGVAGAPVGNVWGAIIGVNAAVAATYYNASCVLELDDRMADNAGLTTTLLVVKNGSSGLNQDNGMVLAGTGSQKWRTPLVFANAVDPNGYAIKFWRQETGEAQTMAGAIDMQMVTPSGVGLGGGGFFVRWPKGSIDQNSNLKLGFGAIRPNATGLTIDSVRLQLTAVASIASAGTGWLNGQVGQDTAGNLYTVTTDGSGHVTAATITLAAYADTAPTNPVTVSRASANSTLGPTGSTTLTTPFTANLTYTASATPNVTIGAANDRVAFYAGTPVAKQTGVAVTAAGIHAALVSLGLIAA